MQELFLILQAESKVKVLEGDIINLLGNSLLHKQEKDDAVENLAQVRHWGNRGVINLDVFGGFYLKSIT